MPGGRCIRRLGLEYLRNPKGHSFDFPLSPYHITCLCHRPGGVLAPLIFIIRPLEPGIIPFSLPIKGVLTFQYRSPEYPLAAPQASFQSPHVQFAILEATHVVKDSHLLFVKGMAFSKVKRHMVLRVWTSPG